MPRSSINAIAFVELVKLLQETSLGRTKQELADETGVTISTAGKWVELLRAKNLVRICSWIRNEKLHPVARYGMGHPSIDIPKPSHINPADRRRAWVLKQKKQKLLAKVQIIRRT